MDRAWAWFVVNRKPVSWGGATFLVVAMVIAIYFWRAHEVEVSAGHALSRVEAQFALPGGARNESAEPYLKVASEHAGTDAGARALLQAGATLFTQGKYAEAQTQFQKFSRDYADSPLLGQALLGNAACLDALTKTDEAAAAYKGLFEQRPGEAVANPAKFALARIYESQGKLEQARALYDELSRGDANSSIGNEAGLKAEELRQKMLPPAATNTASVAVTTTAPAETPSVPILSPPPVVKTNQP